MNVVTDYWRKPIPTNAFDWSAIDADTYDGAPDTHPRCPIGYGATEAEARADLAEQLAEQDGHCSRCGEDVSMCYGGVPDGCRDPRCPGQEDASDA